MKSVGQLRERGVQNAVCCLLLCSVWVSEVQLDLEAVINPAVLKHHEKRFSPADLS